MNTRRSRFFRCPAALAAALTAVFCAAATPASADDFWSHWGDGKAELCGYALSQPRYGEKRDGTAVLIFVTEDFSDALRVKADPGRHPASDVRKVMKLNFVRRFQTGIYDYHVLTSTFARVDGGPAMPPSKVSFSAQEWCGHVYQQWIARGTKLIGALHSYFDGEADAAPELPLPDGGVMEDALPILVREMRGEWLAPGASRTVPFLPSAMRARFEHRPQTWGEATVSRGADAKPVATTLGSLRAVTFTVAEKGGPTTTWEVEAAPPRRLLGWRSSSGESATLLGATRLPYWQLNQNGGERYLEKFGLRPPARATKK